MSEEQDNYRDMLAELLNLDHGLTDWEIDFLDSLSRWEGYFTQKQAQKLQQIYDRHL